MSFPACPLTVLEGKVGDVGVRDFVGDLDAIFDEVTHAGAQHDGDAGGGGDASVGVADVRGGGVSDGGGCGGGVGFSEGVLLLWWWWCIVE